MSTASSVAASAASAKCLEWIGVMVCPVIGMLAGVILCELSQIAEQALVDISLLDAVLDLLGKTAAGRCRSFLQLPVHIRREPRTHVDSPWRMLPRSARRLAPLLTAHVRTFLSRFVLNYHGRKSLTSRYRAAC